MVARDKHNVSASIHFNLKHNKELLWKWLDIVFDLVVKLGSALFIRYRCCKLSPAHLMSSEMQVERHQRYHQESMVIKYNVFFSKINSTAIVLACARP